jgi:hypothetical protein
VRDTFAAFDRNDNGYLERGELRGIAWHNILFVAT